MFPLAVYFLFSLLLLVPVTAAAHVIHRTDGRTIQTERIEKKGDKILYEQFGGTITIGLDQVQKIVYGNIGLRKNVSDGKTEAAGDQNLAARLVRDLAPATPIEQANLATVFIRTAAGSGSGFFLTNSGLIVTNRHVVRGSPEAMKHQEENFRKEKKRLAQWKTRLDEQKQRIKRAEKQLQEKEQELDAYAASAGSRPETVQRARENQRENEQTLQSWQRPYRKNLNDYLEKQKEFTVRSSEYNTRTQQLARQNEFSVTLADGTVRQASLYTVSSSLDLALLKIHGFTTPRLQPMAVPPPVGTPVYALGSPLGLKGSVTSGVLSAVRKDYLQTNAEIYPGNSGGPLVTADGKVIGVNTMKMITDKFEGLGFAIPIAGVLAEFHNYLEQP
jgi:S1-C subfamily serine protease